MLEVMLVVDAQIFGWFQNMSVSRNVHLIQEFNWNVVWLTIEDLPWSYIGLLTILFWFRILSLLVARYVPTKVIHVHNKGKSLIND